MDGLLYWLGKALVTSIQLLPLRVVARAGRLGGAAAWVMDGRHRNVALEHLTAAFGKECSAAEIREIARENFKRLGENYCCAVKTSAMNDQRLPRHLVTTGADPVRESAGSAVFAVGHFGNFELYARGTL